MATKHTHDDQMRMGMPMRGIPRGALSMPAAA